MTAPDSRDSVVEDLRALTALAERATPGEWMLATSCSWRRILTITGNRVIVPITQQSDGHPDLNCGAEYINAEVAIAAVNFIRAHGHEVLQALARGPQQAGGEDWPKVRRDYLTLMTRCEASIRESNKATLSRADMEAICRYDLADEHLSMMQADRIAELEAALREAKEALSLIAAPQRPDGTWNRDRAACQHIAERASAALNGGQDDA